MIQCCGVGAGKHETAPGCCCVKKVKLSSFILHNCIFYVTLCRHFFCGSTTLAADILQLFIGVPTKD